MKWFTKSWWLYLLKGCKSFKQFFCRIKGHDDVIWYNPNGLEPDMRCKSCEEDLG